MAKTGFWLKGAQGKLAGAALQKGADGNTIIREIVTPKNPQTTSQMIQRIIMATVGVAYSTMKEICDHSYEGITKGAATMNAFRSFNANMLRDKVTNYVGEDNLLDVYGFSPIGMRLFCLNEYQVSRGSLPQVPVVTYEVEGAQTAGIALSANTYGDLISQYGLKRGDQLTFLFVTADTAGRGYKFHFARVILDPRTADGDVAPLTTAFVQNGAIVNPSPRNEGEFSSLVFSNGHIEYAINGNAGSAAGYAVIVSRKGSDDVWRRSDSTIVVINGENGYTMQECLDRIEKAGLSTLSETYLNNAGTGNLAGSGTADSGSGDSGSGDDDDAPGAGSGNG